MPFLDHLEELRWRIFKSLIAVLAGAIVGFVLAHRFDAMNILLRPLRKAYGEDFLLSYLSPADPFFVTLKVGLILGVLLALPILIYQFWVFFSPALKREEKRAIVPALYLGFLLFSVGVAMAYFIALPMTLVFFGGFQTEYLQGMLELNATLGFILRLLIGFGLVFELPVVIMVLTALGLVTPAFLRTKRRHAYVLITILASLVSPGDVILLTLLMMVPLIVLYEASILLSVSIHRRREGTGSPAIEPDDRPPEGVVGTGG